jgi:hypothetical protein
VAEMAHSALVSALGSQFDDFLFAPVGVERNGMLLSVLSALARQDIDPWREAANLAELPRDTATERLSSMIAALPDQPSADRDCGTIAAHLIALLPQGTRFNIRSPETSFGAATATNYRAAIYVIAFNVMFTACMLGAQWIAANRQLPAQIDNASALASTTIAPQTPPSTSGR